MDFCQSCTKEVGSVVTFNDAGQLVKTCVICQQPLGRPVTATVGRVALNDAGMAAAKPVVEAPAPRPEPRPVTKLPEPRKPAAERATADDIITEARTRLAALDLEIPQLEADLARAKAHRRGLQRMVDAYDKGAARVIPMDRARKA